MDIPVGGSDDYSEYGESTTESESEASVGLHERLRRSSSRKSSRGSEHEEMRQSHERSVSHGASRGRSKSRWRNIYSSSSSCDTEEEELRDLRNDPKIKRLFKLIERDSKKKRKHSRSRDRHVSNQLIEADRKVNPKRKVR